MVAGTLCAPDRAITRLTPFVTFACRADLSEHSKIMWNDA